MREKILLYLEQLVNTPSVVGYYPEIHQWLEQFADKLGLQVKYDKRHTAYLFLPGRRSEMVRCVGAHMDTIGMIVRSIEDNGWLSVRNLGGVNFHSLEGENVLVHTHQNGSIGGMVICKSHSVHVFDDARSMERDFPNMKILLDEDVRSKEDVLALGIRPGDLISCQPRFVKTESGFVKSRHLDDKAAAAAALAVIEQLVTAHVEPAFDTYFAFPIYEEIGLGAAFVPDFVDEYLALDIGLLGGEQNGDEKKVSICGADRIAPYDWHLTGWLCELAEQYDIPAVQDIYYRYSTDATAALKAGQNLKPICIGPSVYNSHGYERTHIEGIEATARLLLAYLENPTPGCEYAEQFFE